MSGFFSNFRKFLFFSAIFTSCGLFCVCAQEMNPLGFVRNQQIPVIIENDTISFPWTGGLNSVAFYNFDLDFDGIEDLLAFEKNGNRLLPFLWRNGNWQYAPEYARFFPPVHDWVVVRDYDNDGLKDLFTYSLAGIAVYHNMSNQNIEFELVTNQLESFYYSGYVNIYASPDDYLVVEDVDGDGDLDILNFWVLGKYVHYQRNWAVENDYVNGFLDYRLEDECWGKFSEGADDNEISLSSYCQTKQDGENTRHVGSTMLLHDFNDDGLKDLVLGDIDYPNVILLTNGGSDSAALMVSQTLNFPQENQAVQLYSMPLVSMADINSDEIEELLVSPSDPSLVKSQNKQSVWMYSSDTLLKAYILQNTDFIQNQSVDLGSGAYPVLFDYDKDGLLDLFVGNYGYYDSSAYHSGFLKSYYSSAIAYFKNVGTASSPSFQLINEDFGDLRQYNYQALYPTLADIDEDGQVELLCGCSDGTLLLRDGEILENNYLSIDVGDFATPQFYDIDHDGKMDLLIGNRRGHITYYHNESSNGQISFSMMTDELGSVDVRDYTLSYYGYATPCFFEYQGTTMLVCGNEQGHLFLYDQIDDNLNGVFRLRSSDLKEHIQEKTFDINEGIRIGVAIANVKEGAYPDLFVGNYAGGLSFFEGSEPLPVSIPNPVISNKIKVYPNPASQNVNIEWMHEGYAELRLYDLTGRLVMQSAFNDDSKVLNISNLSPSIYIGLLISAEEQCGFKLIVRP